MAKLNWVTSGADYTNTPAKRTEVLLEILRLEWRALGEGQTLEAPFMQGEALKAIMAQIGGRHTAVAWNGVLWNRYGLLGLQSKRPEGPVRSYWLDHGNGMVCLLHHNAECRG